MVSTTLFSVSPHRIYWLPPDSKSVTLSIELRGRFAYNVLGLLMNFIIVGRVHLPTDYLLHLNELF
jgi:hypothetical protein